MAYFVKKTIPSKKGLYLQIYESYYDANKDGSRNRSYKSLGYVCDLKSKGIDDPFLYAQKLVDELNSKDEPQISEEPISYNMGYFLLKYVFDLLNLDEDLKAMTSYKKFQYDFIEFFKNIVYCQCIDPSSKKVVYEKVLPTIYNSNQVSYDQILDGIEFIGSDYQKYIELLNKHISNLFKRKTNSVYFDCTNYYFEIDLEDNLRRKGPSKENRKSPIISQALMLDSEQIPIAMSMFPGNESETSYLRNTIEDIKNRYEVKGKVIQVADKGLNCAKNIYAATNEGKDGYIFSKSINGTNLTNSEREWILKEDENNIWFNVYDKNHKLKYRYKEIVEKYTYKFYDDDDKVEQVFERQEKRIVTFNPSLHEKKKKEILKEVDKAVNLTLKNAFKKEYGDSIKYVNFKDENDKKVRLKVSLNQDKIDEDLKYAGYNLLVTSEIHKSAKEIYKIYHNLWKIEESFRILKTCLEARPVYLQKEETIYGHFLICYYALTILRILEIKIFDEELNVNDLINYIRNFNVTKSKDGSFINNCLKSNIYLKIKEKTQLAKLGNLYLTESNLKNILNGEFSNLTLD